MNEHARFLPTERVRPTEEQVRDNFLLEAGTKDGYDRDIKVRSEIQVDTPHPAVEVRVYLLLRGICVCRNSL